MSPGLKFVVFIGIPSPENIGSIEIFSESVEANTTEEIDDAKEKILVKRPLWRDALASFYKPKTRASLNPTIVRDHLARQTLEEYADELCLDDVIHEVFGVAANKSLPRWTLIMCLRPPTLPAVPVVPAPTQEEEEEATDIVGKMKRDFKKYTTAVASGKTPSAAAKSTNYSENQNTEKTKTALLDGRVKELGQTTAALPIELYHPAFAKFRSNAQDPNFEVPDDILRKTAELIRNLSTIRVYEDSRTLDCNALLAQILGTTLDELVNGDKTAADFTSPYLTKSGISAAPTMVEIKSEWGSGGCDPCVQVSFSYARFYCQDKREPIRDVSCCPSFLVGLAGSWIGVLGAVMTTSTIVQRLSGFEWFGASRVLDNQQVLKLGRLLYALKLGIIELQAHYSKLDPPTAPTAPAVIPDTDTETVIAPRFCPYINSFVDSTGQTIEFSYVTPLEHDPVCATFKAKLLNGADAGKLVVVKFVESYGVDAHQHLAEKGFAPRLIHDGHTSGPRYGGFSLIVMDFVKGKTLHDLYKGADIPDNVRKAIRKALDVLAEKGFIFGDLRRPNVMLAEDAGRFVEKRLRFIDFDWACREGDGMRYPFHLASVVREPSGAREYDIIERKHQESMFEKLDSK